MNKQEYLERLQECLKHKLPREEIEDIMRDYAEYFEEGRRQSQQDSQIAAKLGDPELVAQQLSSKGQDQAFMQAKIATARFYAEHILVKAPAQRDAIVEGAASVTALALDAF